MTDAKFEKAGGDKSQDPTAALANMIRGYRLSQLLYVVAKLDIAALMKRGPMTGDELGKAAGANSGNLIRILRALVAHGVFQEITPDKFGLSPLAEALLKPEVRNYALMQDYDFLWRPWGELLHQVTTGEVAFERSFGENFWTYVEKHPDAAMVFDQNMNDRLSQEIAAVMEAGDFSGFVTIVDVAAGQGQFLAAVLNRYPAARGILFDQPSTIERARQYIDKQGLRGRCELVAGSFFDRLPGGGDAYVLQAVLHDWDNERAVKILKTCRAAMSRTAKLFVIESVLSGGPAAVRETMSDITMMVLYGGMERTEAQLVELLSASGFRLSQLKRTPARCILEAEWA